MEKKNSDNFGFENLLVYQKSLDYVDYISELIKKFPKEEIFALTSQLRRASYSISLNIGEGSGGTTKEFKNFLRISFRSLNECVVYSTIAQRRKYIN